MGCCEVASGPICGGPAVRHRVGAQQAQREVYLKDPRAIGPRAPCRSGRPDRALRFGACDPIACSLSERAIRSRPPFRSVRPDRVLRFGARDPALRFGAGDPTAPSVSERCGPIAGSVSERAIRSRASFRSVRPDRVLRFGAPDRSPFAVGSLCASVMT